MSEKKIAQTKTIEIFEKLRSNSDASRTLSALVFNLKRKVFGDSNILWKSEPHEDVDVDNVGILNSMIFYLDEIKQFLTTAEKSLRESTRELEFREFREEAKK